jgi:hypothetical protein
MTQDINEALGMKPRNLSTGDITGEAKCKYCSSCGSQAIANAEMCPHCGAMVMQKPVGAVQNISSKSTEVVGKLGIVFGIIASVLCFIAGICCFSGDYMGGLGALPTAIGIYFIAKGFFLGPMIIIASQKN